MHTNAKLKNLFFCTLALVALLAFTQCNRNKIELQTIATTINATCPHDVGMGVIVKRVEVVADNEIRCYISIPFGEMIDITPELLEIAEMRIIDALQGQLPFERIKKLKATISVQFDDSRENELAVISLPYEKYAKENEEE